MNQILFFIVIFALILHFLFTDKGENLGISESSDVNESLNLGHLEQNESIKALDINDSLDKELDISHFELNLDEKVPQNEANSTNEITQSVDISDDEDDDLSLSSILPSLKEMIAKLKPEDKAKPPRKKSFFPRITQNDVLVLPQSAENGYFDISELPQSPNLTRNDLRFSGKSLKNKLFAPNKNGKILWQNEQNWELWKKNVPQMRKIYTLLGGFYLYKSEDGRGFLSDELYISLQKNAANAYFIAIATPKSYANHAVADFTSVGDYFIFKSNEQKFIIAYLFNRDFAKWWDCALVSNSLKCENIGVSGGFNVFSSDTNGFEMRLSELGSE